MGLAVAASTHPERGTARPAAASAMLLADGRLHLHHGPIDLVIGADGTPAAVRRAYRLAAARFDTILDELVGELDLLRRPLCQISCRPAGDVAARMWAASMGHIAHHNGADYVTAMAAVAGAVADEILAVICYKADLDRAYVNNGGDIALFLNPAAASRQEFSIGICADPDIVFRSFDDSAASATRPVSEWQDGFAGTIRVTATDQIGGIATSGWKGRSHSLGIADLVTVLAPNAAAADVAATLIANAVVPDAAAGESWHGIERRPAHELSPDSDLRSRLVTVAVDALPDDVITAALHRGFAVAWQMCQSGKILAAYGVLQGHGFNCTAPTGKAKAKLAPAVKTVCAESQTA